MTATFGVNANNDLYLDNQGNIAIVRNIEATLEACAHACKAILGEMVLATDQGIPYFQVVWVGTPNIPAFTNAIRQAILQVEGVVEIVSLIVSRATAPANGRNSQNTLAYSAIIRTVYGTGSING